MIDFNFNNNMKSLGQALFIPIFSVLIYFLLVTHILPNTTDFVDYSSDVFMEEYYVKTKPSVVQIYRSLDGHGATGSGVYVAPHIIITNNHVVRPTMDDTDHTVLVVSDSGMYQGNVLEYFPGRDLAVVRTPYNRGEIATLGRHNNLKIGQKVVSIGASFGKYATLGVGYITGLDRFVSLPPFTGIISVSTGIMPGNSGGGVFNMDGELIGISYAGMRGSDNMGFVIPIPLVEKTIKKYISK